MRSGSCRYRSKKDSSGSFKSIASVPSEDVKRSGAISVLWRRRTELSKTMVREGRFREDLLFRLRTIVIDSPPLREIPEDIKKITVFYMNDLCERFGMVAKRASPEFWETVTAYPWPGNVRELIQGFGESADFGKR